MASTASYEQVLHRYPDVQEWLALLGLPTDEQWRYFLRIAAKSSIRDRLMLSLAYCGALRRAELVFLRIEDLDVAHRLISVRAETTKGRRSRVVCYSPDIAPILGRVSRVLTLSGSVGAVAGETPQPYVPVHGKVTTASC